MLQERNTHKRHTLQSHASAIAILMRCFDALAHIKAWVFGQCLFCALLQMFVFFEIFADCGTVVGEQSPRCVLVVCKAFLVLCAHVNML